MNTEYIKNENILIVDRLSEIKNIRCANKLDKLSNNMCSHDNQISYNASCPIRYTMYKLNDEYKCFKNCPENLTASDIANVNYNYNNDGKQCIQKNYINNIKNNITNNDTITNSDDTSKSIDKIIAYNREIIDVKCNNTHDIITDVTNDDNSITKKCIKYIKTLNEINDLHKDECPIGSIQLTNTNKCVGSMYDTICKSGYDKIGNSCYKLCNDNFMTVDILPINKSISYSQKEDDTKCINNNILVPSNTSEGVP